MKKILAFTMALLMVMSAVFTLSASAAPEPVMPQITFKELGFTFYLNTDGTATICGVPEGMTEVTIPTEIDGYKVSELGSYAQRIQGSSDVLSITVPEGVMYLNWQAISAFNNAQVINLPSTLVEIEYQSFFDSTAYYQNPENWDNGVMYIGTNLITVDRNVPEVLVVREGTTCVSQGAVRYTNTVIKEVVFPNHPVNGIEALTTSTLERATVPAGMETVTDYLFSGCEVLTDVTIEDGITAIGEGAFRGCTSLDEIVIPESVTAIGEDAFATCENLNYVYIPPTVTSIDEHALGYERYSYRDYFTGEYTMKYRLYNDFSIGGEIGSAAHEYAQANNIPFIVSSDEVPSVPTVDEACFGRLGDADTDREITIKDATAIQKHLASLDKLSENGIYLADTDGDGLVTIKDATAIQKYIAGLSIQFPVGDTTDLRLYYHVYAKKGLDWTGTDNYKCYFRYYKDNYDDMIGQPGLLAEFNAVAGGWGAYIPADAKQIQFSVGEYDTEYIHMPEQDCMILVPTERSGVYLYSCEWQTIGGH